MAAGPVHERLAALELVDHHCDGAVTTGLERGGFESLLSEGEAWPGVSPFDSPAGLAVRRQVFERVYLDVSLTLHHVGPARTGAILAEALEVAPFRKLLYSSDAYGVAEFHHLGAPAFRQGPAGLLQERVDADEPALPDALRIARWAGRDNARRVYRLPGGPADDG
ncbi:amidohydrolase family protein [Streptomyces sp. NPDC017890]|uniref:amidohydrolase family protein n=1 Tax=Streptomyces sp. NPDC017890 TaxID=3365015 RepID=UPI003797514D